MQVAILGRGTEVWNEWRRQNFEVTPTSHIWIVVGLLLICVGRTSLQTKISPEDWGLYC